MNKLQSTFKILARSSVLATCFLVTGFAQAGLVSITSLNASWLNIDPVSIVAVGNGTTTATMSWGSGTGSGHSGYGFTTATTPIDNFLPPSPSGAFDLGTWTHFNNPITGTTLSTARLQLAATIFVDGVSQCIKNFLFDFSHNETPNGGTCEATTPGVNVNGCADIVTIAYSLDSDTFAVGDDVYTLNILAGSTYFETMEAADNAFVVEGELTLRSSVVPEPSALMLMGLGLGMLSFVSSKRRYKN
jgi:hypothetical protein